MKPIHLLTFFLLPGLSGCVVGPASISMGRPVYNEVINRTEDEQLLNIIVRDRYDETFGILRVASVTANIRVSANVRGETGLSRTLREDYAGELVPLSGGLAYEDNPTISYIPLSGEDTMLRLLTPLTIDEARMLAKSLRRPSYVFFNVGIKSINGLTNPLVTKNAKDAKSFLRAVKLVYQLEEAGVLLPGRDPDGGAVWAIMTGDSEHAGRIRELLELLGITESPSDGRLVLPLRISPYGHSSDAVYFETRSVLDILRTAGACIQIPESHLKAGVVAPVAETEVLADFMQIRTSRTRPGGQGTVAVNYRGWWYYVDDTDTNSKRTFTFLRTMVALRLREQGKERGSPVLTIPVG